MFPHLVREYVSADTDFLVNLTNDGWFGEGGEQWQHTASAVFRAVENGVPLLRCCNNGVTCWIDARGVVRQVFRDANGGVHGAGVMTAQIPLLAPGEKREPTFYNRHGDWFGWGCVGLTAVVLLPRLQQSIRSKRNKSKTNL
jgi:apolipoprotein N-acyltransferase